MGKDFKLSMAITDKFNLSVDTCIVMVGHRKVNLNELSEAELVALTKTNPTLISVKKQPEAKPSKAAKES